jgi:hypothetical protein
MPTLTELTTIVTDFFADYSVYLAAGAVISLIGFGLKKLIKAGR